MANIRQNAERLLASHINIIPLTKKNDGKGCLIQNWQEIVFNVSDFTEENNIGINLRQSNLIDVDLEEVPFQDYVSNKVKGTLGKALFRYYAQKNPELAKIMR